jgi:long-chain acyl-CoA synthetase
VSTSDDNLASVLTAAAERWGGRRALVGDGDGIAFAELDRRSGQAAALLRELGVRPGDRVGLQVPNSPAFVALYYGILRLGAIVVPQNPRATDAEVDVALGDADVRLLLGPRRGVEVGDADAAALLGDRAPLPGVAAVDPGETAVILYTSGTTGRPKGAELTHANLRRNAAAAVDIYGLSGDDVVLGALPLYHSYGQTCTLNGAFAVGAAVALVPHFHAEPVVSVVARERVTVLLGVPTMFSDLAHVAAADGAFASLRVCSSGGAPLPAEVHDAFEARAGAPLFETYGLSETSPIASSNAIGAVRRPGTVGWPVAGTEMRVVGPDRAPVATGAVGEVAIRGHNIMKGYWNDPAATAAAIDADGWFYSGDLGVQEPDGAFRIVGRVKDMIIRGGLNVYPRELEELMHEHPAVRSVAVVGVPDDRLGEEVGAAVVLEPGARATPDELRAWMRERVTPYKYPRHVWLVDTLPTGPTGKILKRAIAPPAGVTEAGS